MPTYRYVGDFPIILSGLSYGDGVTVTDKSGDLVDAPAGSTVCARPGDVIVTPQPYGSVWLVDIDAPAPATVKDLKATLDAAGVTYPAAAKKPQLQELVDALPTNSGEQPDPGTAPDENEDASASEHSED